LKGEEAGNSNYEAESVYNFIRDSGRLFQAGDILGHYGNGLYGK